MIRIQTIVAGCMAATIIATGGSFAATTNQTPATASETQNYSISYEDWDLFLSAAVLRARSSVRAQNTSRRAKGTGTKLGGSKRAKPHDANRIAFKALKDQHLTRLSIIQSELAAVPMQFPLESFSADERLAFWLNLRNISVVLALANNYPVKKINKLVEGEDALFGQKSVEVNGTAMSINDMTHHILANWKEPLVIYGLFEGAVGSPSLRHKAYTGESVYKDLRYNARDFVNSQRGVKIFGGKARISEFYHKAQEAFPELKEGLVDHIRDFAQNETLYEMGKAKSFTVNQYDWTLTDVKKRTTYRGGRQGADLEKLAVFASGKPSDQNQSLVSEQAVALLNAAELREKKRAADPTVTVEDYTGELGGRIKGK